MFESQLDNRFFSVDISHSHNSNFVTYLPTYNITKWSFFSYPVTYYCVCNERAIMRISDLVITTHRNVSFHPQSNQAGVVLREFDADD